MKYIKIAQLQLPVFPDKNETLAVTKQAFLEAVEQGVDMITLSEMFCCQFEMKNFPLYAEEEGGPLWEMCVEMARNYKVYFSAGSVPEKDKNGNIFNTAYVFDRQGNQIAKHRKMHLFDINVTNGQKFQESETLSPGNTITTFETEFGIFGLCICYDFRFPELGRLMALQGAQVILVPAAFNMTTGPAHWELTFRSQALSNQVYTVGTAPARDINASYVSWGHSIATDPWGRVIKQMEEAPGIQIVELNLSLVPEIRAQLPLLQHRRKDIYTLTEI